jgi:hypothetical protein
MEKIEHFILNDNSDMEDYLYMLKMTRSMMALLLQRSSRSL